MNIEVRESETQNFELGLDLAVSPIFFYFRQNQIRFFLKCINHLSEKMSFDPNRPKDSPICK